ncbi:DHA2 family efflux MFS transporter permease subunit [Actinomadura parmotrematis]|uniref:DHA2 family efflux MFS transporter permease subunit n=1 Tax=Actinomadura parmotrematis TaxID=2864039 RepID=A0ABS7FN37_9ACTN|nr:DHA2 family efflux MFS transporter permease subunit [Actinomadura parmotrematis]MBW8481799.1 DHA2 family efflux MFS transporter permease subunit [Actinomadura parmotrematis]
MTVVTATAPAGRALPKDTTVALVLVLGSIMVSLDMTVVNVALNGLSREFDTSLTAIGWTVTGYTLALAAVVPASAWAAGRFGAKRLYLAAIALFTAGSVLAGLAWDVPSLVLFRAVQGLGGGLVMPTGMTILVRAAGPDRLGRLMGTLGLAILVGPLAGPALGGRLLDAVSWRALFLINLPIGLAVLLIGGRILPADGPAERRPLDRGGLLLLPPGLVLLVYGVTTGGERGGFTAPGALVPLLAGAVLVAAFAVRRVPHPLIDVRLFRERGFAAAAATLALFSAGYFGTMLFAPLYLQLVRGESATVAGLVGIPAALASGTAMQVAGRVADKVPPGRLVPAAVATALAGYALFTVQLTADASYWGLWAAMLLMGAGGGATMMPAMTAAARAVPREQAAAASTAVNLLNTTMNAVGTAVASVVLTALLPVAGGLQGLHRLPPGARDAIAPDLAAAFRHSYVLALVLMALALVPALLLPRRT